jgi:HK97 family phage portal protein
MWPFKSKNQNIDSNIVRAVIRWIGTNTPIWLPDNLETYINKGFLYNPDVYSIVNYKVKKASDIPWVLHEVKDKKSYARFKRAKFENLDHYMTLRTKSLEEIEEHPILNILEQPNPLQTGTEWEQNTLGYLEITGNSYIYGVMPELGSQSGAISELWTLPAHYVDIISGDFINPIKGYKVKLNEEAFFDKDKIMHLKYWNPDYNSNGSQLYGLSPLRAASRVVTTSNDGYTANAKLLQNMGALGALVHENDGADLSEEQMAQLERRFNEKTQGPGKFGKAFITSLKMRWEQMGMPIQDLGILESKKFNMRDLCNVYGLNSALFNDPDNKTYNNMQEARKSAITDGILPLKYLLLENLNKKFIKSWSEKDKKQYHLDVDLQNVPELQTDMGKVVDQMKESWWITPNEKRFAQGFDKDERPEMDNIYVPAGLIPLGQQGITELDLFKDYNAK